MKHRHPVNIRHHDDVKFGQRIADKVAAAVGSWRFIIIQSAVLGLWVIANLVGIFGFHWDPYPFILLNLFLSTQAGFTGPILQLASNRQSQKDRETLEHTFADTERLLQEIDRNTELTLVIVKHLGLDADALVKR